jgi:hypothetical protein
MFGTKGVQAAVKIKNHISILTSLLVTNRASVETNYIN